MQTGYHQQSTSELPSASNREEIIKTHFLTRDGAYKLMTLSEYSRPNRMPLSSQGNNVCSAPVRVSFLRAPPGRRASDDEAETDETGASGGRDSPADDDAFFCADRICFNVGRELYVYMYRGVRNAADLSKPVDKRVYKGTFPTCHDFNQQLATATSCALVIGFSAGQIQLIDPFRKEPQTSRLYNEDRLIDKTRVTCLKWVPGSPKHFLAAHASGQMYLYNEELGCAPGAPAYQQLKQGDGYTIFTCKAKSTRNPIYRWAVGDGAVNEFAFSGADAKLLAVVGQDGYLRVFQYHTMELVGYMRSYFGGLLCVAWSPDTRYLATGGEDDLLSVYSLVDRRTVCRGVGHRSWLSQVAFDPYTTWLSADVPLDLGSDDDLRPASLPASRVPARLKRESTSLSGGSVCYRIGSVGHDTQLCLWDLGDDVLKQPSARARTSSLFAASPVAPPPPPAVANCFMPPAANDVAASTSAGGGGGGAPAKKAHRRGFSLGKLGHGSARSSAASVAADKERRPAPLDESARLLGTPACPKMHEVPLIEPLVCKKISHERLTVLAFREDCIVTACQEGFICTWARPGRAGLSHQQSINSPNPGGSPNLLPGGTVV